MKPRGRPRKNRIKNPVEKRKRRHKRVKEVEEGLYEDVEEEIGEVEVEWVVKLLEEASLGVRSPRKGIFKTLRESGKCQARGVERGDEDMKVKWLGYMACE
ncbi:hypothetical protein QJS10_CPA01g01745 [Acorus calamus]|uniref:Uncharacterized protein n=1 Tax=Acorus calamus TaxID=4465 RepID=A0AAV9FKV5_ACOCL|nr:hypothetical protein QJS10_CPA01g01745 [Acorus calamus]